MVRREIKNFEMEYPSGKISLDVPFSVGRSLREKGIAASVFDGGVKVFGDVYVDSTALSNKFMYLRFGRICAVAEVFVNDKKVGELDGCHMTYLIDVSGKLVMGNNRISVCFSSESDLDLCGIFTPPELIRFNNSIIEKVHVSQKHQNGAVAVSIRLDLVGNTDNAHAVATLVSSAGQMYYAGLTKGRGSVTVSDPLYWWPRGYGVQNLYKLTVNLYGDTDVEDTVEMRIGFRTVETSKSVDGSLLSVNGVDVLPMGAVYNAEPDLSAPSYDRRTEAFITSAAMANYNTVVIPKNSPPLTEKFYDLCDIHGIMVIEVTDRCDAGFADTLCRTAHHPSLCLLDLIDCKGIESAVEDVNAAAPELGFSIVDKEQEYFGHPSLPSEKTLRTQISTEEMNLFSRPMDEITRGGAVEKMLLGLAERYPYPSNLSDLAYLSQLASANKISEYIKERRLLCGKGGRAVFSEMGDYELIASSSAIDFRARWKAGQYYSFRNFAAVALYAEAEGGNVQFSVSSQRKVNFSGTIDYRIADARNVTVYMNSEPLEFDGFSAKKLFTRNLSEYISGHEDEYYLEYLLREGTSVIYSDVLLFVPEKYFKFADPEIDFEVTGSDKRFSITMTSKSFAKDVELDFDGVDAMFSNNYINLTTSNPIKLTLNVMGGVETAFHLKEALRIRSIYDIKAK